MVSPAIDEYLYRAKTATTLFRPTDVQKAIHADKNVIKNWGRDWAPLWEQMMKLMDGLDKQALGPIAAMIHVINEVNSKEVQIVCS